MEDLFREYWWLMFPLMGFVFAAFGMGMGMKMHRDRMALLRAYAEKGQAPPPELAAALEDGPYGGYGYGGSSRYARRLWRRRQRWAMWGPWWGARRAFFFLAVFVAFAVAAGVNDGWSRPGYLVVAIIAGALCLGSVITAVGMFWGRPRDQVMGPDGQRAGK